MLKVDQDLCIQCALCIDICPFTVLEMKEDYPSMKANKEKQCLLCMHCVSICPVAALSFEDIPVCLEKPLLPTAKSYDDLKALISSNRSIRSFSKRQVPLDEIKDVLKVAGFGPSAKNQHPNKWILVYDEKVIDALMALIIDYITENNVSKEILSEYAIGNNVVTLSAPHLLFGIAPKEGAINPYTDTIIALTDVDLLFHAKSIGSCWAGYLARLTNVNPRIRQLIGLEDDMQIYGALAFGYPDEAAYQNLPHRNEAELLIIR